MDKAKAAVGNFMHKAGHNDTTVHEKVAPAVVQETVNKTRVEETQTAIDKEVHQDHYHTSIQPIQDREVLPEQHHHRMAGVEERNINHGDEGAIRARLEQERAQFRDQRVEGREQVIQQQAPVIAGEHVHHHVHETIQPIVQKETIQPTVVHTTVPIHEVHHQEPKHHTASALPAVSMSEFRAQGGSLRGREERVDGFEGEPKPVASTLGSGSVGSGMSSNTGTRDNMGTGMGSSTTGTTGNMGTGMGSSNTGNMGTGMGSSNTGNTGVSGAGPHNSRMENKLDPRVDSNNDGRAGVGK